MLLTAEFDIDVGSKDGVPVTLVLYCDTVGVTFDSVVRDSDIVVEAIFVCETGDFLYVVESDMDGKYDSVEGDVWIIELEIGKVADLRVDGFVIPGIREDDTVCVVVLHAVVLSQPTLLLTAVWVVVCLTDDSGKESRIILTKVAAVHQI